MLWDSNKNKLLLRIKEGVSHLGEELGLWGMLGPPCGVRVPWQLSVTSRQMIAVLPDPALPTMTAPRPSQLLVFPRTSSRRVKSQSRPTKGVSAVMPGTSNSSGLSMMSACLNGTNLPGRRGRTQSKLFENGSFRRRHWRCRSFCTMFMCLHSDFTLRLSPKIPLASSLVRPAVLCLRTELRCPAALWLSR